MIVARHHLYLVFAIAIAISAAVPVFAQPPPSAFISLPQFLTAVRTAHDYDYVGSSRFAVESEMEFEVMRQHLLSQYDGVTATHSFLIDNQYVDCIPVMQQPSVRHLGLAAIATPPPLPVVNAAVPPSGVMVQPLLSLGLTDSFGNAIQCDGETIPMRRVSIEDLARFPTFRAFLAKDPPHAPSTPCNNYYRYAVGETGLGQYYGAQTTLAIWYPSINTAYGQGQHSLSQMWVEASTPNTSPILQTAEAGWIVDPSRFNTNAAVLFVFYTSFDYYSGYGCYDTDCSGFVVAPNSVWVLGAANPNWPGSSISGNSQQQYYFGPLQWTFYQGNWWLSAGSCPPGKVCNVGYYPGSIYGSGLMSGYANKLVFGGEVASPNPPGFSPMGSGALASAGALYAAYQWNASYLDSTGTPFPANLTQVPCTTNSSYFTFACYNSSCSDFYFGGPGGPFVP
jgi:hypothetical protein